MKRGLNKGGRHPFKWMMYEGRKVSIDKDIVPLISNMWKLGIKTTNCCQGYCSFNCKHVYKKKFIKKTGYWLHYHLKTKYCYDNIWIAFDSMKDYEAFINIIAEYSAEEGSMYHHILGYNPKKYPRDAWAMHCHAWNDGEVGRNVRKIMPNGKRSPYEVWMCEGVDENDFVVRPQITFPRKHLAYVENRLQLALKK